MGTRQWQNALSTTTPSTLNPASSGNSMTGFTRCLDLWFSDGSIVITAQNTTMFRVHTSIFAQNCEVFRDMAVLAQPALAAEDNTAQTFEGLPVVHLQDSAVDMQHFLKTFYDLSYFALASKSEFPIIAAVLRLSTKYHAPALRGAAIKFLTSAYPSTLEAWLTRDSTRRFPRFEKEVGETLELALTTDVKSVLPASYYAACKMPVQDAISQLHAMSVDIATQRAAVAKFVTGKEILRHFEVDYILGFIPSFASDPHSELSDECDDRDDEVEALTLYARTLASDEGERSRFQDVCFRCPEGVGRSLKLCKLCSKFIEKQVISGRVRLWESLPSYFNLSDWAVLTQADNIESSEGL